MRMLAAASPRMRGLIGDGVGNEYHKPNATERTVFHTQLAALGLGGSAGNRQTKAGAKAAVAQPLEFTEDAVARGEWNTGPSVTDFQLHAARFDSANDRHRRAGRRVHANILQQITECLIQEPSVEAREWQRVGH